MLSIHRALLWARAHHTTRLLGALALLLVLTPLMRWLGGDQLPTFFDPLLVPAFLAIAVSLSWQGSVPHLERRNPNLALERGVMLLAHLALGLAVVAVLAQGAAAFSEAVRSYLIDLGILGAVMSVTQAWVARVLLLARALPAAVLLPAPDSIMTLIWWEFQRPTLASYLACVTICCLGLLLFVRRGAPIQ